LDATLNMKSWGEGQMRRENLEKKSDHAVLFDKMTHWTTTYSLD